MLRRMLLVVTAVFSVFLSQTGLQTGALSRLPAASAYPASAQLEGGVRLTLNGQALPYDAESDTYYLPVTREQACSSPALALENEPGTAYAAITGEDGSMLLTAHSGEGVRSSRIVFTSLPVIALSTASGELPGDEDSSGEFLMLTGENGRLRLERSAMEINLRGNTSRSLPKKSYRVKIVDDQGGKRDLSIGGLRSDDDWIFNPMYSDTSKIREPLSYWLWDQIDSSAGAAESSRAAYAEVLLNGRYWGLYGVQERIDRKQVGSDKRSGILYKVFANYRPTTAQLLECNDDTLCEGFEVQHAGSMTGESLWLPAASYMAILDGEENAYGAQLSLSNTIEYGLWAMLTQAYDCHFKNQFLHCVFEDSGYTMYKIPWDLNHTLGDAWNGDSEQTNYLDYVFGDDLVFDGAFDKLLEQDDPAVAGAVRARWQQLRSGAVTESAILTQAHALHSRLSGALARDSERWPQSGMGDGNADNIRDIEAFVHHILPRIDKFVQEL